MRRRTLLGESSFREDIALSARRKTLQAKHLRARARPSDRAWSRDAASPLLRYAYRKLVGRWPGELEPQGYWKRKRARSASVSDEKHARARLLRRDREPPNDSRPGSERHIERLSRYPGHIDDDHGEDSRLHEPQSDPAEPFDRRPDDQQPIELDTGARYSRSMESCRWVDERAKRRFAPVSHASLLSRTTSRECHGGCQGCRAGRRKLDDRPLRQAPIRQDGIELEHPEG
jgi:hypothetical protein